MEKPHAVDVAGAKSVIESAKLAKEKGLGIVSGFCYRYTLTGTDSVGNTASIFTIVKLDTTAPNFGSPALTLSK